MKCVQLLFSVGFAQRAVLFEMSGLMHAVSRICEDHQQIPWMTTMSFIRFVVCLHDLAVDLAVSIMVIETFALITLHCRLQVEHRLMIPPQ